MGNTAFVLHAISFTLGFYWLCYQKDIDVRDFLRSLLGGILIGAIGVAAFAFLLKGGVKTTLPMLPAASLLGATVLLWIRAHDQLANGMSRDSIIFLTASFAYFFSPWEASFRLIGLAFAAPCLVILMLAAFRSFNPGMRLLFVLWAALASLVIGVQQLWLSPETLVPTKGLFPSLSSGPIMYESALASASLAGLLLNLVPFIEWVRGALGNNDQMLDEAVEVKRSLVLITLHGLPLLLNWKFQYFSYDGMLSYSLVWSPLISTKLCEALFPESANEMPPWLQIPAEEKRAEQLSS